MPQDSTNAPGQPKLYRLVGEHVQAWCAATSSDAAGQLFEQHLEPFELSATDLLEVPEDEWPDFGISKFPGDSTTPAARLLSLQRGEFH